MYSFRRFGNTRLTVYLLALTLTGSANTTVYSTILKCDHFYLQCRVSEDVCLFDTSVIDSLGCSCFLRLCLNSPSAKLIVGQVSCICNLKLLCCCVASSQQALIAEMVGSYDAMDLFRHTTELNTHVSVGLICVFS